MPPPSPAGIASAPSITTSQHSLCHRRARRIEPRLARWSVYAGQAVDGPRGPGIWPDKVSTAAPRASSARMRCELEGGETRRQVAPDRSCRHERCGLGGSVPSRHSSPSSPISTTTPLPGSDLGELDKVLDG